MDQLPLTNANIISDSFGGIIDNRKCPISGLSEEGLMKPFGNLAYPSMVESLKAKSICDADEGAVVF